MAREWHRLIAVFGTFSPLLALQHLYIYGELCLLVVRALQEVTGGSAIEVLPSLRSLVFQGRSLSGSMHQDIQGFINVRQNSDHPVDVKWKESKLSFSTHLSI